MKLYSYENYQQYIDTQIRANKNKLHQSWVKPGDISSICQYLADNLNTSPKKIICHGTRSGKEQSFFQTYLPKATEVIGTEISPTAKDFPNTIEHDFSEPKTEWKNCFDLLYSNSFDHSYDPEKTLLTWKDQIHDQGLMVIEWSSSDLIMTPSDPFIGDKNEYQKLFERHSLTVKTILKVASTTNKNKPVDKFMFILQK